MQVKDLNYQTRVRGIFEQAAFVADVGIRLLELGAGWVESELLLLPRHMQQDQFVHAGVQATMADHSAGAAAASLIGADETVLTVEFKINLLRPGGGEKLHCRAEVLKPGKTLSIVESWVYGVRGDERRLIAKATVTLAVLRSGD